MSLFENASLVITPNGTKASKLYSIKPTDGSGDLSVTRATTATRVNSSGLIESVATNVPRLDYTNSTCPSILVEPQRTNICTYSELFDNGNWNKNNVTLTANNTAAPDGTTTADLISSNTNNGEHNVYSNIFTITPNVDYTFSYFVKKGTGRYIAVAIYYVGVTTGFGAYATYDLNTNTLVASGAPNGTFTGTKIETLANGWVKISVTGKGNSVGIIVDIDIRNAANLIPGVSYTGANETFSIWGAQLEQGSYATSYIPTTSASVTRNADVISKTGISSLIGQTEGTIFLDWIMNREAASTSEDVYTFAISDGTSSNVIALNNYNNSLIVFCITGGSTQFSNNSFSGSTGQRIKLAIAYKLNDIALYINGNQIATDSSATIPVMSKINIGSWVVNNFQDYISVNTNAIWKTRLSNTELATLTTI